MLKTNLKTSWAQVMSVLKGQVQAKKEVCYQNSWKYLWRMESRIREREGGVDKSLSDRSRVYRSAILLVFTFTNNIGSPSRTHTIL